MAGHNDPRLLYSIGNINAYHLQDGAEQSLTPSGPQTLSLLMVPTSSPFEETSNTAPEEDFYLHLNLPPELDISLPATTQIYHQPPSSYLIPRWDLGPESGAFTRIEFPKIGSTEDRVSQEDVDTFETILAQCTAFLERAHAPGSQKKDLKQYNPQEYGPGEAYVGTGSSSKREHGHIVLVDEEDGSVVGELSEGFDIVKGKDVMDGSKNPVEFQLPQEGQGNRITVNNVSEDYLKLSRHPAFANSSIVQNAATASRLIVTGSSHVANAITGTADSFTRKTKPNAKPMTFAPATQARVRKLNNLTNGAVALSAKTVGSVGRVAQNLGASMTRRGEARQKAPPGFDGATGAPIAGYRPGVLNKSMIAFSTIADGIEQSAKNLLESGQTAAFTVVGHKYGPQAGSLAGQLAGGIKNVGLVYVDAAGVSRKAVLKSVAKGMVVGRMPNGNSLVVGEGDGGNMPSGSMAEGKGNSGSTDGMGRSHGQITTGNSSHPPAYEGGDVGEEFYGREKR